MSMAIRSAGTYENSKALVPSEYDVIIIGGGTAGLVIARRLTEDSDLQVLVLEAGADKLEDPKINIAGLVTTTYGDPEYDWDFITVPQEHLNGRRIAHPRGKVLGGSSAINLACMIYPSKTGLDAWASLGNEGWDWETMAPYYRKFQKFHDPDQATADTLATKWLDSKVQGRYGPIETMIPPASGPIAKAWLETFKNLNYELTGDPLSGAATGGFANPMAIDPGQFQRSYAANAYYAPVADSTPNLHVLTEAMVEKIVFEKSQSGDVVAKGVQYLSKGNRATVTARKEVILSAGSIQSPQILELSGIGAGKLLRSHGIDVLVENPYVGENLQDHVIVGISFETHDNVPTAEDVLQHPERIQAAMQQYLTSRTGFFTGGISSGFAFMPLVDFLRTDGQRDLQVLLDQHLQYTDYSSYPAQKQHFDHLRSILAKPDEASGTLFAAACQCNPHKGPAWKDFFAPTTEGKYCFVGVALNHPFSRGNVHINNADPLQPPLIDPQYFSHPLDVEIMARHVQFLEVIAKTEPMASLLKPGGRRIPRSADVSKLQDAMDHCKNLLISNGHPSGTCAMMPRDMGGVVNERLLVYGTANLRIVDASVFPMVPRGNIMSSVYAAAERAADLIKEDLISR